MECKEIILLERNTFLPICDYGQDHLDDEDNTFEKISSSVNKFKLTCRFVKIQIKLNLSIN